MRIKNQYKYAVHKIYSRRIKNDLFNSIRQENWGGVISPPPIAGRALSVAEAISEEKSKSDTLPGREGEEGNPTKHSNLTKLLRVLCNIFENSPRGAKHLRTLIYLRNGVRNILEELRGGGYDFFLYLLENPKTPPLWNILRFAEKLHLYSARVCKLKNDAHLNKQIIFKRWFDTNSVNSDVIT